MKTYNLDAFGHITSAKVVVSNHILTSDLPTLDAVKREATWPTEMSEVFDRDKAWFEHQTQDIPRTDRSASLSRLAHLGAENGWSDEQIMVALLDADNRWEKYAGRKTQERLLLDLINRARAKHGYQPVRDMDFRNLLKGSAASDSDEPEQLVYNLDEFLAADFHVDWMLQDLFAIGGFGLITGYPGVGKTRFATQMCMDLATGRGKFLKWTNVGSPKKVLFLSLEMGPNPLHLFLSNIAKDYEDDWATAIRNFNIVPVGSDVPLDTKEGQAFLTNLLDEYMPDVLLIDSLHAAVSKDLSDAQAVKEFMDYTSQLRKRYQMAILMVHHNRKKSNDQQAAGIEVSDVYGSQFISARVEYVLTLNRVSSSIVNVNHVKNRLGPEVDSFEICDTPNLTFTTEFENIRDRFSTAGDPLTTRKGLEI